MLLSSLCVVVTTLAGAGSVSSAPSEQSGSYVLFSVAGGGNGALLDPVAVISRGGVIRAPFPPDSDLLARRFLERWLKPGRTYRVLFGGSPAGTATVRESPGDPGISLQAPISLKTVAKLGGRNMALATSGSPGTAIRSLQRRDVNSAEKTALLALVRPLFQDNGVSAQAAKSAKIITSAALNLDGTGRPEIAARLQATNEGGGSCDLFVIAEPSGRTGLSLAMKVVNRNKETKAMEDMNYVEQDLVDALDIDGDGIAEVVTRSVYYESHDYAIFQKRSGGRWRKVYRGAGGGV